MELREGRELVVATLVGVVGMKGDMVQLAGLAGFTVTWLASQLGWVLGSLAHGGGTVRKRSC